MASLGIVGVVVLAAGAVCGTSGCSTLGYYAQSINGHLGVVRAARPVPEWLADPATPQPLKDRLALSQRIRDYAVSELKEPDNPSYRRYADLHRASVIWNVVAAPELSLTLQTWCFPVVGCVGYRGYYDEAEAQAYGETLKAQGLEVSVYGVPAYSTLGKLPFDAFADPLLNTFIDYGEGDLARLIFHELAHQIAYAKGDTVFNESFATAVERIGGERWMQTHADAQAMEALAQRDLRREGFRALTLDYRARLLQLYESPLAIDEKRARKAALMTQLRATYEQLKREQWGGFSGYDGWFARANNAAFGVLAAYNELVPNFERLYEREGRNFDRFYAEVRRLAELPQDQRRAQLP